MKDEALAELIRMMEQTLPLLADMPDAPEALPEKDLRWNINKELLCQGCSSWYHISDFKKVNTGYIEVLDPLCASCSKELENTSYLACVRCKEIVSRMKPHKDNTGFVFEKNKVYHMNQCPGCVDDCVSSTLAEKVIYDRKT
tara:strand:+ start:15342 stop:15767 length:426 start_codon:yes stop_codon:yes gene_type:complete